MSTAIQSLLQQRLLLDMEHACEREAFRKQTEERGMLRMVKRGDAWWPVRVGRSYYNSLNQLVMEIFRTTDEDIDHNFEFGRPVVFFAFRSENRGYEGTEVRGYENSLEGNLAPSHPRTPVHSYPRYFNYTATVSYIDGDRMVVAIPEGLSIIELQNTEGLGIQLSFDETSYQTMADALERVIRAKDNRLSYLRDLFYSKSMKAQHFSFQPMRFPYLNATQERAVNQVLLAKDVAIVHGPPGTGKTTTLVEAVYETLRREPQVLVCAQSNLAVDWISEKLTDRGVNVLRIGNPTRVNDKMLSFTYERRFEAHPDYPQLWAIRKAIRELRQKRHRGDGSYHQKMDRLKSRAAEIEIRINAQLFGEARVIASTLVGSANRLLHGMKFGTLFIDEATQALEAACWIPICKASRVVFAGDHCQLPPTVKSFAAKRAGFDKTLMERIVENKPEEVTLLKTQYRMNDQIMRFSSDWFYQGQVESSPMVSHRGILDYDLPIVWIDTSDIDAHEEFIGDTFGRINKTEAELTLAVLQHYFEKIGRQRILEEQIDVGIISPYRAQVQHLRRLIRKREFFKPYRHLLSVGTVDGFQGQERDVILISLVRANDDGQIGFLNDLRRMNVAITRARMKLIILGDTATLCRHPFYAKLYKYIEQLEDI